MRITRMGAAPQAGKLGLYERPGLGFDLDYQAVERAAELHRQQSRAPGSS
ncbi:MAG: hypothetical protein MUQ56_02665 [Thermoleophilia bacterium]|nr:hypothetical protein [Thermoleophilia bacterium]